MGTEALRVFDSEAWVPDTVVSDLALPDLPGEQLARVALGRHARVVLISGDRTRLAEAQDIADRTLAKPFSLKDLFAAMGMDGH
jgi:DNA-binding response OmpR family regulator